MQTSEMFHPHTDKRQRWDQLVEALRATTDALGLPIGDGIVEAVVVLNALGLATIASCEGHLDRGEDGAPYPWIEVEATSDPKRTLDEDIQQALLVRARLMDYLERFYTDRVVSLDQRLTIQSLNLVAPNWRMTFPSYAR